MLIIEGIHTEEKNGSRICGEVDLSSTEHQATGLKPVAKLCMKSCLWNECGYCFSEHYDSKVILVVPVLTSSYQLIPAPEMKTPSGCNLPSNILEILYKEGADIFTEGRDSISNQIPVYDTGP